jgi:hypothetical protein
MYQPDFTRPNPGNLATAPMEQLPLVADQLMGTKMAGVRHRNDMR